MERLLSSKGEFRSGSGTPNPGPIFLGLGYGLVDWMK
jgi:hypothetical protein